MRRLGGCKGLQSVKSKGNYYLELEWNSVDVFKRHDLASCDQLCSAGVAGSLPVNPRGAPLPLPMVICLGIRHMAASPRIPRCKMVKKKTVCRATSSLRIKCSKVS